MRVRVDACGWPGFFQGGSRPVSEARAITAVRPAPPLTSCPSFLPAAWVSPGLCPLPAGEPPGQSGRRSPPLQQGQCMERGCPAGRRLGAGSIRACGCRRELLQPHVLGEACARSPWLGLDLGLPQLPVVGWGSRDEEPWGSLSGPFPCLASVTWATASLCKNSLSHAATCRLEARPGSHAPQHPPQPHPGPALTTTPGQCVPSSWRGQLLAG